VTENGDSVPNIFPVLRYADANKAVEWLATVFGFREIFVARGDDGTIHHAQMSLGPGIIMFASASGSLDEYGEHDPIAARNSIYVYVADVEAHFAAARAAGAEITRDIEDTDYGSKEYSARDFEGNHWSFGTYLPTVRPS
jgi:uncharacterized glyoxalase superfamily protein PhnB